MSCQSGKYVYIKNMFILCNRDLQSPTSFKVINIKGCDECRTRRYVKTFNRDFKIQRRGRQQERQKNKRFNKQNNNFARALRFFCTFLSCFCTTSTRKLLISRFKEDVNKLRRNFISLSELEYGHLTVRSGGFAYI